VCGSDQFVRTNHVLPKQALRFFRVAFEGWVNETDQRDLRHLIRESFEVLKAVTAGSGSAAAA
jgi:hypothetical protein